MTKNEALAVAKMNHTARTQAEIEHLFHGGPEVDGSKFSYRHGWYSVGSHSFSTEDVTGAPYDITQGGLAYL